MAGQVKWQRNFRLLLFRHGQSEANLSQHSKVTGRASESILTHLGTQQAEKLGNYLDSTNTKLDFYFASTAERAKQTALIAMSKTSWFDPTKLHTASDLEEIHMGDWVGQDKSIIYVEDTLKEIQKDPWQFAAPGGESQKDVASREALVPSF